MIDLARGIAPPPIGVIQLPCLGPKGAQISGAVIRRMASSALIDVRYDIVDWLRNIVEFFPILTVSARPPAAAEKAVFNLRTDNPTSDLGAFEDMAASNRPAKSCIINWLSPPSPTHSNW